MTFTTSKIDLDAESALKGQQGTASRRDKIAHAMEGYPARAFYVSKTDLPAPLADAGHRVRKNPRRTRRPIAGSGHTRQLHVLAPSARNLFFVSFGPFARFFHAIRLTACLLLWAFLPTPCRGWTDTFWNKDAWTDGRAVRRAGASMPPLM
jgi:hypothetical protein